MLNDDDEQSPSFNYKLQLIIPKELMESKEDSL